MSSLVLARALHRLSAQPSGDPALECRDIRTTINLADTNEALAR
jgi:hypothetical protein